MKQIILQKTVGDGYSFDIVKILETTLQDFPDYTMTSFQYITTTYIIVMLLTEKENK